MRSTAADASAHASRPHAVLSRWPTALGVVSAAGLLLTGADRETVAVVIVVATTCYLAAAALDRPWVAWAAIPAGAVVIAAGLLAGAPPWVSLGVAALVLVVVGLLGRASRPTLGAQATAMLLYGGLAVAAIAIAPGVGLVLAASALIAHGIWDVVHLRSRRVVSPSLAEACVALDVPLGVAVLVLAATGA